MLSARNLSVTVGGRRLFRGLTLALEAGERVALVGPSGSGKTSLLRVLSLLIDPSEGELTLDGATPLAIGIPRWRRRVAFVAQRPVLFEGTTLDNLRRPFRYASVEGSFDPAGAARLLERVGLSVDDLPPEAVDLSEGQKQRVALVRALLTRPDVLLLDEPTSGLDAASRVRVEELIAERVEGGSSAVLWVTHDAERAGRDFDRTVDLEAHLG